MPPPPLEAAIWAELEQNGLARRRIDGDPQVAMGVDRWAVSREEAWLSITDDTPSEPVKGVTELVLAGRWSSEKLLYQYLDLPWPLQDRHWAIRLRGNAALAEKSGVWERHWKLDEAGMELARPKMGERYAEALMTPVNEGDWLLLSLGARDTLVIYQTRASLGGGVPDSAVEGWAFSGIAEVMEKMEKNALRMRTFYSESCDVQPGADGRPIPCFGS